jgi:type I restriction enzyme, S subunit
MKRYDSYKDSGVEWIGKIPSHWRKSKFKFVSDLYTGNSLNDSQKLKYESDNPNDIPYVSSKDIDVDYQTVNYDNGLRIPKEENSLKISPKGSFLMVVEGGSSGRKMVFLEQDVCFVNKLCSFNSVENTKFQYYFIQSSNYQDKFRLSLSGLIGGVSISNLKDFELTLPPLSEQQQIVSFLDTKTSLIDSLIEKTQRKIELLKEKRTSLINEIVTKGLNSNVEMKDSGVEWIGKIPIHYQMISIKFLVTTPVTDGPHETPEFVDEGIPFLSVNGVVGNKINFNKVRGYITNELHIEYSKKCKPQRDDVLLVKSGSTTGKSTIVETDLNFNIWSPLCIIRSNTNKIIPRFTFHTFQSGYFIELIENNWSYGTQPNIGMNVIENLSIVVPPISEQKQIVEYLDEQTGLIDKTISIEEKRIELIKEYRQSLISEVVTGKRKVV